MTTTWLLLVLLVVGLAAAAAFASWRRRVESAELGSVSHRWMAEQRANDRHYSER